MKRSVERILTTHTGSLPRPPDLVEMLSAHEAGRADEAALARRVREAVAEVVRKQVEVGVDVLNDGETSKFVYSTYVKDRLTGFGGTGPALGMADLVDFPEYVQKMYRDMDMDSDALPMQACIGDVRVKDRERVRADIDNLRAATEGVKAEDVFMSAASPGVIAVFFQNQHYPSHEAYVGALADAMKEEYEAIAGAGFVLQLDCPDLAMGRHIQFPDESLDEFRRLARVNVEALNHATAGIDPDQMRMHLCWGNYEGPHHKDVALKDIIDIVFEARPNAISFEACNPRHEHEWQLFEEVKLPEGKLLIPGVIDSTNNYIEHPELIAQRLTRYARLVGQENVMAGSDCGFATAAGASAVVPTITWAKFEAMAEGARLASGQLQPAGR
ncbi:MAG: cobalamin-independent methionine synthase II family protein [Candidatus Dormibacteraeota bacterium]|nr:cobalamin-independent methionine synthase II family protein [Candidatus Dormibacteraeota bacterium]